MNSQESCGVFRHRVVFLESNVTGISHRWKVFRASVAIAVIHSGCAPDAVKSADTGQGNQPATTQLSADALDKLPPLTAELIRQKFTACGLPADFGSGSGSGDVFSASLAAPGPLKIAHKASGCFLGYGDSVGVVSVSLAAVLRGPFTGPTLAFNASTTIESQCNDKYSSLAAGDAAPFQRTITYDVLPVEKRPEQIGNVGPWKMAVCTLAPVTGLRHQYKTRGAGNSASPSFQVQVEFIPAIPALVIPAAARGGAFSSELGKGLQFEKILARVKASNDPRLPVGREITGTVTILPIKPVKSIIDPDARTQTSLTTDIGIRVSADFGSPQVTQALGLFPFVEYFIDKPAARIGFMSTANPDFDPRRTEILYK